MQLVKLADAPYRPNRTVAIGEFDGVHLGHRRVIEGCDTVLTFDPHPRWVVSPESAPKLITSLNVKADLIKSLGVQELIVVEFDRSFASKTADEFIESVLIDQLGTSKVSVGENFRFGNKAAGDITLLQSQTAFSTRVVQLIEVEGEIVTSTHIRGLLSAGEIESANRFLGSPYQYRGIVATGDQRGRDLGYPTANLIPSPELIHPDSGVYACIAKFERAGEMTERAAAVSIGVRPTFETGRGIIIEAYLLDFAGDLYGQPLTLEFHNRLRGERRFDTVDALVAQMGFDVATVGRLIELGN